MVLKIAVSGIPRGYQFPKPDGNWLNDVHKEQILSISSDIELTEIPAHEVNNVSGIEVILAEGGNRVHYPGELDWGDYQKFFTPNLRWVQLCSTGFSDNVTSEVVSGRVILTNAPGLHTIPIAESVLAAMLDHAKRLKQRRIDQEKHEWNQLRCDELYDKTILLIGLGNIGKRVAKLCKSFDMNVIGTKRKIQNVENVDQVFKNTEIKDFLSKADYVVVAAPLTPETENMLGEKELEAMKSSTYLINVGRGKIVHEPSLIKALEENWIAGAYLDCLAVEPLPSDHIFWEMDNVFLIPHDSHSSPYIGNRIVNIFCENLQLYIEGKPLKNICNPQKGY
jgi:phosphoglycerate dehydrogenase-like enzyme